MTQIITHELLKTFSPCADGYRRYCELFPEGTDLKTAIEGLSEDNHDDWAYWLFCRCRDNGGFETEVSNGYMNTGDRNTGDWNTGDWNTGYMNTGDRNTGDRNTGDWNTGDRNTGDMNTGYMNTGDRNTGDMNTGDRNTGDMNTGDMNTGYMNTGDRNTGDMNTGDRNTGDWNKANFQTGYFNTVTPDEVMVFNKPFNRQAFIEADKPSFIFNVIPNIWIDESEMTDQEKIDHPKFYVAGGYLKSIPMQDAWKTAWDKTSETDRAKVKDLPNFDADIFFEITGIRVSQ